MYFSIKDYFSKRELILSFLRLYSYSQKKSLMDKLFFFAMLERFTTKVPENIVELIRTPTTINLPPKTLIAEEELST